MKKLIIGGITLIVVVVLAVWVSPYINISIEINPPTLSDHSVSSDTPPPPSSPTITRGTTAEPTPIGTKSAYTFQTVTPHITPLQSMTPDNISASPAPSQTPSPISSPENSVNRQVVSTTPKATTTQQAQQSTAAVVLPEEASAAMTPQSTASQEPNLTEAVAALDSTYLNDVLNGINDTRASYALPALILDDRLSALAQAHAEAMAAAQRVFHSSNRLVESVASGSAKAMSGYVSGTKAAIHAGQLAIDPEVTRVGIGACSRDGVIYVCVGGDYPERDH